LLEKENQSVPPTLSIYSEKSTPAPPPSFEAGSDSPDYAQTSVFSAVPFSFDLHKQSSHSRGSFHVEIDPGESDDPPSSPLSENDLVQPSDQDSKPSKGISKTPDDESDESTSLELPSTAKADLVASLEDLDGPEDNPFEDGVSTSSSLRPRSNSSGKNTAPRKKRRQSKRDMEHEFVDLSADGDSSDDVLASSPTKASSKPHSK